MHLKTYIRLKTIQLIFLLFMTASCVPTHILDKKSLGKDFYYRKYILNENCSGDKRCREFIVLLDSGKIRIFDIGPWEGNISYHRGINKIIEDYYKMALTNSYEFNELAETYYLKNINKNSCVFSFSVYSSNGDYRHRDDTIDTLIFKKNGLTSKYLDIDSNLVIKHYKRHKSVF